MSRLIKAFQQRAESAIVIVYAPAMDDALRLVLLEPAPARATIAVAGRAKAQRVLSSLDAITKTTL